MLSEGAKKDFRLVFIGLALEASIKASDESVMETTEQCKSEHKESNDHMASNTAAKEFLGLAKKRID